MNKRMEIDIQYYKYGKKEIDYLKNKDSILGKEIDRIGMVKRVVNPHIFSALISSIISQQISTKAARTVENRLIELISSITPENIDKLQVEDIQKCGMSTRKGGYIKDASYAAISKTMDFDNLYKLENKEFVKELTKLRGVGPWTAEMLLIHSLQREDVISYKDLGIRRGIEKLYDIEDLTKEEFKIFEQRYRPYGTVASIYLWEISHRNK